MHITKPMLQMMKGVLIHNPDTTNADLNAIALAGICLRQGQPIPASAIIRVEQLWSRAARLAEAHSTSRIKGAYAP